MKYKEPFPEIGTAFLLASGAHKYKKVERASQGNAFVLLLSD